MKEAPGWNRRWTSVAAGSVGDGKELATEQEARRGLGLLPASTTERGREQISGGLVGLGSDKVDGSAAVKLVRSGSMPSMQLGRAI